MAVVTWTVTTVLANATIPRVAKQENAAVRDSVFCSTVDWSFTVQQTHAAWARLAQGFRSLYPQVPSLGWTVPFLSFYE